MKKILFISHEASFTGAPLFLAKLVKHLEIERPVYKIAIFFPMKGELVELMVKDNFEIFVSEKFVISNSVSYKFIKRVKHYYYYIKVLLTFRPNLIYSNTILNFSEIFLAKFFLIAVLLHIHEGKNFCSQFRLKLLISCFFTNKIIVGSHYVNSVLFLLTKRNATVVHNGVSLQANNLINKKLSNVPFKIGILGTINPNKGQFVGIEALNLLIKRRLNVKLHVAGKVVDEEYFAEMHDYININMLSENVEFLGVVQDSNTFLNSLDLLLVPSFDEAFPTVILEAFSTGTLVLASNVGGIPEIIQHRVNGFMVEAGNAGMLADAIEKIIINYSNMHELKLNASNLVKEKFDIGITHKALVAHIDKILCE